MHKISGYHLKAALGEGGSASVFLATQQSLERPVAIKVLQASLSSDQLVQRQFAQESRIIARLNHPNIVQVIDQGTTEAGLPFFAMPYIKSISLDAIIARDDVSMTRKLDILIQICSALAYAHRNGILHRDIKPANVLVDYEGHVRLVDFGIAGYFTHHKIDPEGGDDTVMGTDAYMAPEQHQGNAFTTERSDIYALGILMHELIYGLRPAQALRSTSDEAPNDRHRLALHLHPLIEQCLQPRPEDRPASAEDLRQSLLLITQGRHLGSNRWGSDADRDNMPPNYTLLDVLKENPFGATYLVNDPNRHRLLVIKKQGLEHLGSAPICAAKLTQVQHPHIARIYGTGKNTRVFILVSEYLPAGNLQDRLSQAYNLGEWMSIAQQLCNALACAHAYGIVHGNLRPSNILYASKNHLKLSDFGFPAHTYGEQNLWYQPSGEAPSKAADIYAAGAILFQLFSGKLPTHRLWGLRDHWSLRHLPKHLRALIRHMTHPYNAKRIASAELVAQTLNQLLEQQQTKVLKRTVNIPTR